MTDFSKFNDRAGRRIPSKPTRRHVLSITGGGLLGVIPAAMLLRFEELGKAAHGKDYRLCDSFDLVGGASTGAVIATGIAMGMPAEEIASFYLHEAPIGFRPRRFSIPMLHDKLDDVSLRGHFARHTGGKRLCREDLECDLMIVTKNMCRSVPMALSTLAGDRAPQACLGAELRGDPFPLDSLLRASTAVPGLYRPELLRTGAGGAPEVCIDGGLSPFNNAAPLLAFAARSAWDSKVSVTSLGTGSGRPRRCARTILQVSAFGRLIRSFAGMVGDVSDYADEIMNALQTMPGSDLRYTKYDLELSSAACRSVGIEVTAAEMRQMRAYDDLRGKKRLFEIARSHAANIIDAALPLKSDMEGQTSVARQNAWRLAGASGILSAAV